MRTSGDDRILKDANGSMRDHLQSHIHLTNCIHLKNHHLHNHTPSAVDSSLSLLRDLQKSRHLRDPSRSPNSRLSPSLVGLKEHRRECTRMSASSPLRKEVKIASKEKRRRFGSARRNRLQMSSPSNSFSQSYEHDDRNRNGNSSPGNRCGIPSNWSRIHHRGKSSSSVVGKEALPLLLDASNSQGSTIDHAHWIHDELGELGIYASNLEKEETDSESYRVGKQFTNMQHQNLTQKYMPRTFKDLVGQSLVVQALSNAIMRRKIGLLYMFYGPHGTGKTACARIFGKALNCRSLERVKPCCSCDSCIEHEIGKSRNVREIGPVSNVSYENILKLFVNGIPPMPQYGVFIFDECDAMSSDCWSAIMKVVYRAPRRVAIVLVCSSLHALPYVVVSMSQKFAFTKLKDADIVYALKLIARKEDLEVDEDALKLIASKSDGSLRDAEMTLDQLSLLGQRITLCVVQELIGLISDEKLLDLLDFALSADTMNTIKNLRDITASGVEPLALMSQLATVITDVLAGSFGGVKERPKRKFFHRQSLSKEDMEKLRKALKTLSEAEKQLRVSSERMTWLTAALLQLAPDQHYTSSDHSPIVLNDSALRLQDGDSLSVGDGKSEIVEVEGDCQSVCEGSMFAGKNFDEGDLSERNHSLSIVRRRTSLADVILHAESVGLSVSVADKLEQENMRLEPRSRRLLCWNPPRITCKTFSCLKIRRGGRRRNTRTLRRFVSCGRSLSTKEKP